MTPMGIINVKSVRPSVRLWSSTGSFLSTHSTGQPQTLLALGKYWHPVPIFGLFCSPRRRQSFVEEEMLLIASITSD